MFNRGIALKGQYHQLIFCNDEVVVLIVSELEQGGGYGRYDALGK